VSTGQLGSDPRDHFGLAGSASHIGRKMCPARTAERQWSDIDDAAILDGDAHRALAPVSRTLRLTDCLETRSTDRGRRCYWPVLPTFKE
jgi:hypothetical protein